MVARSRFLFICYAALVTVYFTSLGVYLSHHELAKVPRAIEWTLTPGIFLAVFCLVGVHSDYFEQTSILANIAVFLVAPYLVWRLIGFLKKPRPASRDNASPESRGPGGAV